MIIAILALILSVLNLGHGTDVPYVHIRSAVEYEECEWSAYHEEAYSEYADEFTVLFNSYDVKRAKNGALLIRQGDSGPYRFAKKGM